jgi:integrase
MGLFQNEHGVWCVRKRVPNKLQEAVAVVRGEGKKHQAWLQRSLKTKDKAQAKRLAPPVLMAFDRTLAEAEALAAERPLRSSLDRRQIEMIADYFYADHLAADEEERREGNSERLFQDIAKQLREAGVEFQTAYRIGADAVPEFGLSDREMHKINETLDTVLPVARHALARGDISMMKWEINELLQVFRINLDPKSSSYRELGIEVLKSFVRGMEATKRRQKGELVETPPFPTIDAEAAAEGETLRAALEGWKKVRRRAPNTLREFVYAVDRFVELHGDMPATKITRKHAREFREALQLLPLRRSGNLRTATLPELVEWSRKHDGVPKVSAATVNKILGGVQAILMWARDNGFIPDEMPWADPFSRMRLEEEVPSREPWRLEELKVLFGSSVFTHGARPPGGRGEAAFWLPLLGLFTGARLGELAPLTTDDVSADEQTAIPMITVREDLEKGRSLKTVGSRRAVPVHPELVRIGFTRFVDQVRCTNKTNARLFPLLTPGSKGGLGEAWSKWFGRYIRDLGIANRASVFHSFRHGFKDALRAAGVNMDVNDALTGHIGVASVASSYGAKDMVRRFGLPVLIEAVAKVAYPGLDLSHLNWSAEVRHTRLRRRATESTGAVS